VYANIVKETEQKTQETNAQLIESIQQIGSSPITMDEWKLLKSRETMASKVNQIVKAYVTGICSDGTIRLVLEHETVSRLASFDDVSFPNPTSPDLEERKAAINCQAMMEHLLLSRLVLVHIRKY
jgi:hypothetical protein